MEIRDNRDLYCFVADLIARRKNVSRPLVDYLGALYGLLTPHRSEDGLAIDDFAELLEQAFDANPVEIPKANAFAPTEEPATFDDVTAVLWSQAHDLREMNQAGTLADDQRYFGANAPSGARWYNFDPWTYLECGIQGAFGGWDPDDEPDTGRQLVPGNVAVLRDGEIQSVPAEDIEEPVVAMGRVDWDDLIDFLHCGQCYE